MSKQYGNLVFMGQGQVKNFTPEKLAADPVGVGLWEGRVWTNETEKCIKFFLDGEVKQVAEGGSLEDYLRRDGTLNMLADLTLSSDDQSAAADTTAVSKKHVETRLSTKQNTVTGAATSIVTADLTAERVAVSDASGKVAVSAVTTTELGYVGGVTSGIQAQIDSKQDDLGYVPVNRAGDSMTGQLAMNNERIIGVGAPVNANDAIRKIDLDTAIANLNWQDDVLAIQVDNTLVPELVEGSRYIVTDVANLNAGFGVIADVANNDIVEYVGGAFVVAYDISAAGAQAAGTFTTNIADGSFYRYNGSWSRFEGVDSIVAGTGLVRSGNVFNVNMGAGISELPSDEIGIDVRANGGLFLTEDGSVASTGASAQLAVLLQSTGGLDIGVDGGVQVKSQGIVAAMLGAVAANGLTGGNGVAVSVLAADASLTVDVSGVKLNETHTDGIYARQDGADFTGAVTVQAPTANANPATKLYVDTKETALQDAITAVNARVTDGHFVYDGTAAAASTHTVAHGIGQKYVSVTVVDEFDNVVGVDEITYVDANTLTVSVLPASKIRVICVGSAPVVA
jgi:hypothetical protein